MAGHSKSIGDYASLCCDGDKSMSSRTSCLFRESKALPYRIRPCCAQSDLIIVNLAISQRSPPSSENILRPNPVLLSILPNPLQILIPIQRLPHIKRILCILRPRHIITIIIHDSAIHRIPIIQNTPNISNHQASDLHAGPSPSPTVDKRANVPHASV